MFGRMPNSAVHHLFRDEVRGGGGRRGGGGIINLVQGLRETPGEGGLIVLVNVGHLGKYRSFN